MGADVNWSFHSNILHILYNQDLYHNSLLQAKDYLYHVQNQIHLFANLVLGNIICQLHTSHIYLRSIRKKNMRTRCSKIPISNTSPFTYYFIPNNDNTSIRIIIRNKILKINISFSRGSNFIAEETINKRKKTLKAQKGTFSTPIIPPTIF